MTAQSRFLLNSSLKKTAVIAAVLTSSVFLVACTASTPAATGSDEQAPGATTEKSGTTTVTGSLSKVGTKYYVKIAGKEPQEVDSYKVDLSTFEGKTVTITGQFSGDTLFAGTVDAQ